MMHKTGRIFITLKIGLRNYFRREVYQTMAAVEVTHKILASSLQHPGKERLANKQ